MVNNLQIILHIPLFSLTFPPNLMTFFKAIFDVITFDIFDMNPKLQYIFSLKDVSEYPAYNERFDMLGYSSSNTIYNVGMPVFFIIIYVGLLFLYLIVMKLPGRFCENLRDKI
jgi:hypothetical protein